ncbi:acyltransferase [Tsukamurella strandjordii]|uniref:acyltransferase n=1 Tax=Tsukamurella strandjordii TaxID=147577 RepID=UPI0031CEB883
MKPRRALTADLVRVLLFTGVVVAHCVNYINFTPDVVRPAGLIATLLHLTRYGFVAVTLFVLVLSMRGRDMSPTQFWRRRFGLVVAPYLVWTVVYSITDHLLIEDNPFPSPGRFFGDLARTTLTGDAKYQLYFLLISMQIYLVFPWLSRFMKRTSGHPWLVLSAAAVIQVAVFAFYQYFPEPEGRAWETLFNHMWKLLPMYALFIAIGMLAAQHYDAVSAWLRARAVPVVIACGLAAAFSIVAYLRATEPGDVPEDAATAWNPTLLPWLVGGLVLLWLAAMKWDDLRTAGLPVGERAVTYATIRAFGAFAVHPLVLDLLGYLGFYPLLYEWFPASATLRTLTLVVVVLAISLLFIDTVLRTPLSRWVVARDRIPLRRPKPEKLAPVVDETIAAGSVPCHDSDEDCEHEGDRPGTGRELHGQHHHGRHARQ